jgi:23S rRNA pseudouridine1911/1915/1917 synthase
VTQGVDHRTLPVPDGLAGERVDAAMAQMFGLSRTRAAELIARGLVLVDGSGAAKSDRVLAGATLDVTIPVEVDPLAVVPEEVEGIQIIHDDPSIVVISKPVGVAVHPSPGWTGRRWSATWPRPVSRSPPAAPPSGRASCSASTSVRRASW